jgi:2TM domain
MGSDEEQLREEARRRIKLRREFWQHVVSYVIVNAALIGVWAITGTGYFWPGWVLGGWGIGLLFHAWNTFGQKPIREDEIQREMDRLRRQQGMGS